MNIYQDCSSCDFFTLDNQIFECKVIKVYDGDSITVVFPYFDKLYKWNCRLSGIDTPELKTKNQNEKKIAFIVRDKLKEKINDKIIKIKCGKFDKYGRLLCEIFDIECNEDNIKSNESFNFSINNWLIENNYAFSYNGKTKKIWSNYLI
jgi:micrococcal nuclease